MARKTCLMHSQYAAQGDLVYVLKVASSTQADIITQTLAGRVIERRQYLGTRAQVCALCTWATLTGLAKGGVA